MVTKSKKKIINATQASMLEVLRDVTAPVCKADLFDLMGISRSHGLKHMNGLRDQDLVAEVSHFAGRNTPATWSISMAGRRALCDYKRKQDEAAYAAQAAPAPTRDTLGTFYTPPSNVYYRNAGHTHIASRGVRC